VKILVTGGAGFIGSHFVRTMLTGGYPAYADADVVVLDKLTYAGNRANLAPVEDSPRLTFVQGDIVDAEAVGDLMTGVTSRPRRTWTARSPVRRTSS
jgi:dTDP-glucose 4,6-dehydratase